MRLRICAALALALSVAGCDKKAEGQSVAVVNGEEITAAELNAELRNSNLPAGADAKRGRNLVLQGLIDRRILAQQARKDGLDKSPEFLNQQRRATEELLIRMLVSRQADTNQLPSEQEVSNFIAKTPQMFADRQQWSLQQLRFAMPSDQTVVKQLETANSLEDVASILSRAGISFTPAKTKLDTAVVPADLYGRLVTLPPGRPFIVPVGGQGVASTIVERQPAPITGDAARPIAVNAMRQKQTGATVQAQLKSLRQSAKIEYQPGFAPPGTK